jgi:dTMP kinase
MSGKLIVFEGVDHSGKTTQMKLLKDYLERTHGKHHVDDKFVFTREPGGKNLRVCEEIRKVLLNPELTISPITEAYLYAASRAEHCIAMREWLYDKKTVLCDRFVYSSYVYQGMGRNLGYKVNEINGPAIQDLLEEFPPAKIVYFKLPVEEYAKRKNNIKDLDRLEQNDMSFFKSIIEEYETLFNSLKFYYDVIEIDATKSEIEIHEELVKKLKL